MSLSCPIETCKRKSRAICHCCNKNLCSDQFKEHVDLINSRMNPLADEINTLDNQLSLLNVDEIIDKYRQKLDKLRHECHTTVDRFYEEKCQELQQCCVEKIVYIEQWTSNELDISTLASPYRTIACSKDNWLAMTSNNHFLLIDQYPNLCLYDKQLALLKEYPWEYAPIPDMCWSSTLNSFIIITNKNGIFLMSESLASLECIQTIEKKRWLSCTCSDSTLFLMMNESGSNIFQFNLLLSFHFMKQWKSPRNCNSDEIINNIAYNNETLALMIESETNNKKPIELRSLSTFDLLWSTTFNAAYHFAPWSSRVCVLKYNERVVIDYENSRLFHVIKDGQVKANRSYKPTISDAVLFGANILAIKTLDNVNCYRI
ncbi:unnamed protein product [Rotaria socialis]|uniref:Uncharacterized protein n=1 Tax=Rotaria socialis TaxID=392032 RepID=A0A821SQ68_9BILA|nr:unnamed protein product [Rotaria socialis]